MKQVRLTLEELHEIKWLMGGAITLLALWSLASLEDQSGLFLLIAIFLVIAPLWKPRLIKRVSSRVWFYLGPVMLVGVGFDFFLNLPNFIPPLVRLIICLLVYRSWAPRRQREDLQVVLLSLFCLVISGVLTLSLLFAVQILLFAPLAMAILLVVCLLDRGDEHADFVASWDNFSWRRLFKRVWRVANFEVLGYGVAFFTFVVCVSTLLFVLTPRFNLERAIPFLQNTTTARSGFSESVGLNDVTEIQQDDRVALRIDGPSKSLIASFPYWRMLILDEYKNGVFNFSTSNKVNANSLDEISSFRSPSKGVANEGNVWTFYMEGGISTYLPIAGRFDEIQFTKKQNFKHYVLPLVYGLEEVSASVFAFQITDLSWDATFRAPELEARQFEEFAAQPIELTGAEYPLSTLEVTVSDGEREVLRGVLAEIEFSSEITDTKSFSKELTEYLRANFGYSLDPQGIGEGDPVVSWIESKKTGHCQLFAGAFVLLAREAGFPARMVIGYAGGTWNPLEDYFVVRNTNAHAWAEIYDAASKAWIRVDPTPGNGPSDLDDPSFALQGGFQIETGFAAWTDSLRIQWYRRVVNFDQDDQIEMAATLGEVTKQMFHDFKARMNAAMDGVRAWLASPFTGFNLQAGAGIVTLLLLAYGSWRLRYRILGVVFRIFRRPAVLDPVRRQSSRLLQRLRRRTASTVPGVRWENEYKHVSQDLEALRFGPPVNLTDANPVFAQARRVLRLPMSR
ncbi:MAG: DUF3488 and transglutaminase-like domain-containing protein [Verrucomicrobiota bacterium]